MVDKVIYDTVKTEAREAALPLSEALVKLLLAWRGQSQFNKDTDWVWASPYSAGERPLNLNGMQHDHIVPAAKKAGLETLAGTLSATRTARGSTTAGRRSESRRT